MNGSPLVTVTFTTEELAMTTAGLIQLRRFWAKRSIDARHMRLMDAHEEANQTMDKCTAVINKLSGSVTEEQGNTLLQTLVREMMSKGAMN